MTERRPFPPSPRRLARALEASGATPVLAIAAQARAGGGGTRMTERRPFPPSPRRLARALEASGATPVLAIAAGSRWRWRQARDGTTPVPAVAAQARAGGTRMTERRPFPPSPRRLALALEARA